MLPSLDLTEMVQYLDSTNEYRLQECISALLDLTTNLVIDSYWIGVSYYQPMLLRTTAALARLAATLSEALAIACDRAW